MKNQMLINTANWTILLAAGIEFNRDLGSNGEWTQAKPYFIWLKLNTFWNVRISKRVKFPIA